MSIIPWNQNNDVGVKLFVGDNQTGTEDGGDELDRIGVNILGDSSRYYFAIRTLTDTQQQALEKRQAELKDKTRVKPRKLNLVERIDLHYWKPLKIKVNGKDQIVLINAKSAKKTTGKIRFKHSRD